MKDIAFPAYSQIPVNGRLRKCLNWLKQSRLTGKTLIDVGCSHGFFIWKLRGVKLKKVIGIDRNPKAISYAKKHNFNAKFILSKAEKLPVENNFADIVTFFDVLEHVGKEEENRVLREIARVLKKDGVLCLSTPNNHILVKLLDPAWYFGHRHYSLEILRQWLIDAGFKIEKISVFGDFWNIVYINWFYILKWFFNKNIPRWFWLEKKDDSGFNRKGISTIFVRARKN